MLTVCRTRVTYEPSKMPIVTGGPSVVQKIERSPGIWEVMDWNPAGELYFSLSHTLDIRILNISQFINKLKTSFRSM